jgi:hypothetical protein
MSLRVIRCVLDHNPAGAKGIDRHVLVELASYAHNDGTGAWPAQTTLASRTGYGRRTVQRSLAWLEANKAIEIEQRPGRTHLFRVILCEDCRNSVSASQRRTRTNQPASESPGGAPESPGGASEWRGGCVTVAHDPVNEGGHEPVNHPHPPRARERHRVALGHKRQRRRKHLWIKNVASIKQWSGHTRLPAVRRTAEGAEIPQAGRARLLP